MRPHNDPLNRLRVVSPCTEDWNAMTGNDAVRFCSHCSRDVNDIAHVTHERALEIIRESNGRVCARIERLPDGSLRTLDALPGLFSITRSVPRAAAGVFSLALGVSTAMAQQASCTGEAQSVTDTATDRPTVTPQTVADASAVVAGTVLDPQGAVVPGATVTVTVSSTGNTVQSVTDGEGRYSLAVPAGSCSVTVEAQGFSRAVFTDVEAGSGVQVDLGVTLDVRDTEPLMGIVAILAPGEEMIRHYDERDALKVEDDANPPIIEAAMDSRKALWRAIKHENVNARNAYGESVLMLYQYDRKTVDKLIDAGADVNARDRFGVTALMRAAADGNRKLAAALLDRGANVNMADVSGYTALMVAAANGDQRMVQLLFDAGADRSMRDKTGRTAKDYFPVAEPDAESNSDSEKPQE